MKYLIILITILTLPTSVHASGAVNIKSLLMHEAQHIQGDPRLNNVYYSKSVSFLYKSGKLVLSSTPDGTGPVTFFNSMNISVGYPHNGYFEYAGNCQDREIPPINISKFIIANPLADRINLAVGYKKRQCGHATKIDGVYYDYADIGDLYLVHFDDSEDVAVPFLRLPWDYEAAGLSFQNAALQINSYFDHEYPLLSSGLNEPGEALGDVITYEGLKIQKPYSSHDGYDWGSKAQAHLNNPVLAAADGIATYLYGAAQGNAILIDHGNGYQTRYYHLLPDGLVTKSSVAVTQGQQIGLVGSTGNSDGPHIHFMVVKDKNGDGNFEDNIPDGLVDPFGWHSFEPDPWESYSFNYAGQDRTGSPSYYLWGEKNSFYTSSTLGADGKTALMNNFTLNFPKNAVLADTILEVELQPPEQSENLYSVGNIIRATVEDGLGQQINTFNKLWDLLIKFNTIDIERFNPETLSIYSRTEGSDMWLMEETLIDFAIGQARTSVDHMTEFALMGEKLDSIAPETTADIVGDTDGNGAYASSVTLALNASDLPLEHSLGIAYTLYKLNDTDWEEYTEPLTLSEQGTYNLSYFSQDNDHNKEDVKILTFTIDYSSLTPTPTPSPTVTPTPINTPTPTPKSKHNKRPNSLPSPALTHMKAQPFLTHPANKNPRILGALHVQSKKISRLESLIKKILRAWKW